MIPSRARVAGIAGALVVSLLASPQASADVVQCGAAVCTSQYSLFVDGAEIGGGEFAYDAETGEISFATPRQWQLGDGSSVTLNSISGNADPIIGFNFGATTGSTGKTVSLTLDLPIALEGPIQANSSVSYSLTSLTPNDGARIAPFVADHVVIAREVDTSVGGPPVLGLSFAAGLNGVVGGPLPPLDKGVDVGDAFFFLGSGAPETRNSPVYTASNVFTGNLAYDLMSVTIAFALSANSSVGLSGFVQQVVVPLPAALPLLLTGLIGFRLVARRRRRCAIA